MEAKLRRLFDFQKFQHSDRLAGIIADTEKRYSGALLDDDLELVNAAGEAALPSILQEGTENDR